MEYIHQYYISYNSVIKSYIMAYTQNKYNFRPNTNNSIVFIPIIIAICT